MEIARHVSICRAVDSLTLRTITTLTSCAGQFCVFTKTPLGLPYGFKQAIFLISVQAQDSTRHSREGGTPENFG